jgi:hypothetical protein
MILVTGASGKNGAASMVSPSVRDVTGRPPHTFADFARDYKQVVLHSESGYGQGEPTARPAFSYSEAS